MVQAAELSQGVLGEDFTLPADQVGFEGRLRAEATGPDDTMPAMLNVLSTCVDAPETIAFMNLRAWEHAPEAEHLTPKKPGDRGAPNIHHESVVDADNIPESTISALTGLYGLTGATVVRDDLKDGEDRGFVIRRGEYQGAPVYFTEYYGNKLPEDSIYYRADEEQRCLRFSIMGAASGEEFLNRPTFNQQALLEERVGSSVASRLMHRGVITRENFDDMMELTDAAGKTAVRAAIKVSRVRQWFRELGEGLAVMGR